MRLLIQPACEAGGILVATGVSPWIRYPKKLLAREAGGRRLFSIRHSTNSVARFAGYDNLEFFYPQLALWAIDIRLLRRLLQLSESTAFRSRLYRSPRATR